MSSRPLLALASIVLCILQLSGSCKGAPNRLLLSGGGLVVPQIANGSLAQPGQYPFIAALYSKGPKNWLQHYCGGSLISPWVILTAAHCTVDGRGGNDFPAYVKVGMVDTLDNSAIKRKVTRMYRLRDYNHKDPDFAGDVALLQLDRPVNGVLVPKLSQPNMEMSPGQLLEVAGFGETESNWISRRLRYTEVEYVDIRKCKRFYGSIAPDSICAGGASMNDACAGDSGGPLLLPGSPPTQVGIVSFGQNKCGGKGQRYGGYVNVAMVQPWVKSMLPVAARRGRKLRRQKANSSGN